ncbi:hypothetical protein [Hymenobacter negativus]|uniref:Uncharacterized protein n=1 Tax=Hymenobacter negativus TaxID=2795026 RepID=A0ABS0Q8R4_9BACT|nr:hypothetical protein [Hymenobacter negativus]MBH8558977.1 hypothetical protein [Hymenobacter negativus]
MKRYPKGVHAATPHLPGPGPLYIVDGPRLAKIMGRAYHRHLRWVRYRVASRNGVVSPFARLRNRRLAGCFDRLSAALAPFRETRSTGHAALGLLLDDPECRPHVARHVQDLLHEMDFTIGEYERAFRWLQALKPDYYGADEATQARQAARLLPFDANQLLTEIKPLYEEAVNDLQALKRLRPHLFPRL